MKKFILIALNLLAGNLIIYKFITSSMEFLTYAHNFRIHYHVIFSILLLITLTAFTIINEKIENAFPRIFLCFFSLILPLLLASWIVMGKANFWGISDSMSRAEFGFRVGLFMAIISGAVYWFPLGIINLIILKDKNHSSRNGKIEVRGGDFFKTRNNRYVDEIFYLKAKKPNRPMESFTLSQVKEIRIPDHAERNELYEYAGLNVFPSFKYALPYWLFEKCDTYLVVEFTDGRKLFGKTAEYTYNRMPDSLKRTRDDTGVPEKPEKMPLIKLLLPLLGVSYILLLCLYTGVDTGPILLFLFLMLLFLAPFKFRR